MANSQSIIPESRPGVHELSRPPFAISPADLIRSVPVTGPVTGPPDTYAAAPPPPIFPKEGTNIPYAAALQEDPVTPAIPTTDRVPSVNVNSMEYLFGSFLVLVNIDLEDVDQEDVRKFLLNWPGHADSWPIIDALRAKFFEAELKVADETAKFLEARIQKLNSLLDEINTLLKGAGDAKEKQTDPDMQRFFEARKEFLLQNPAHLILRDLKLVQQQIDQINPKIAELEVQIQTLSSGDNSTSPEAKKVNLHHAHQELKDLKTKLNEFIYKKAEILNRFLDEAWNQRQKINALQAELDALKQEAEKIKTSTNPSDQQKLNETETRIAELNFLLTEFMPPDYNHQLIELRKQQEQDIIQFLRDEFASNFSETTDAVTNPPSPDDIMAIISKYQEYLPLKQKVERERTKSNAEKDWEAIRQVNEYEKDINQLIKSVCINAILYLMVVEAKVYAAKLKGEPPLQNAFTRNWETDRSTAISHLKDLGYFPQDPREFLGRFGIRYFPTGYDSKTIEIPNAGMQLTLDKAVVDQTYLEVMAEIVGLHYWLLVKDQSPPIPERTPHDNITSAASYICAAAAAGTGGWRLGKAGGTEDPKAERINGVLTLGGAALVLTLQGLKDLRIIRPNSDGWNSALDIGLNVGAAGLCGKAGLDLKHPPEKEKPENSEPATGPHSADTPPRSEGDDDEPTGQDSNEDGEDNPYSQ